MHVRLVILALAALLPAGCGGCGDNATADPDGGETRDVRLEPLGRGSFGLAFGETATLRVQYEFSNREVIPDAVVDFAILESPSGDPGGATLSATSALTNAQGVATVDVTAGAARANFRVEARAEGAAPAYFYVSVSQDGFVALSVTPTHAGHRDPAKFDQVELRLYEASTVGCADFDVDGPPVSVFQPVTLAGFDGEAAVFDNVSVGMDYTLAGWGLVPGSSTPLAAGCVALGRAVIAPGQRRLEIAVRDRLPVLPAAVTLGSTFLLAAVADDLAASGTLAPWDTLACPAGPGQLLLDCTVDALEPDGDLDCAVTATGPRITSIEATRGPADGSGCRPPLASGGGDSLDQELTAAVTAGGAFPSGTTLGTLLDARADTTELLSLTSTLAFDSDTTLTHRLDVASLGVSGTTYSETLGSTARPIVAAAPIAWRRDGDALAVDGHGFTLRLGSLARDGFRAVGLAAAGLEARAEDLGTALAESASDPVSTTLGCDAVSAIVCGRIGESADCAAAACVSAAGHLDGALDAWWRHLDGSAIDFALSGRALVVDDDDDLVTEGLGTGSQAGTWSAAFTTRTGAQVGTAGSFSSTAAFGVQR